MLLDRSLSRLSRSLPLLPAARSVPPRFLLLLPFLHRVALARAVFRLRDERINGASVPDPKGTHPIRARKRALLK